MIEQGREVIRYEFPPGYATTRGTVGILTDAVRAYHTHPRIIQRARYLVHQLPSMDIDAEIRAIWDFLKASVRYVRDPLGAEYITAPAAFTPGGFGLDELVDIGQAQEDCESIALYAAALLAAIGIPSEFEIQGRDPSRPDRFTHCALRVQNPRTKQWIPFDLIGWYEFGDAFDLGDSLHVPGEPIQHFNMNGERTLDGLLGELFGDAGSTLSQVEQYGDPIANVLQYVPYGNLVAAGYKLGTGVAASQIGSQQQPAKSSAHANHGAIVYKGARPGASVLADPQLAAQSRDAAGGGSTSNASKWVRPAVVVGGVLLGAKLIGVW